MICGDGICSSPHFGVSHEKEDKMLRKLIVFFI